jgi:hypothetical protein
MAIRLSNLKARDFERAENLRIRFKGSSVVTMDGVLVEDDRIVEFGGSVQTDGAERPC